MSENLKEKESPRWQRFKDWGEFVFALVLTVYGVAGYYAIREQLDLTWRQMAVTQDQVIDGERSDLRHRADLDRQFKIAEDQAKSLSTLSKSAETSAKAAEKSEAATEQLARATASAAAASRSLAESAGRSSAATQGLADAAALQLERTDRPYVAVSISAAGPVTVFKRMDTSSTNDMNFYVHISVTNEGRSTASRVRIESAITFYDSLTSLRGDELLIGKEIDIACDRAMREEGHFGGSRIIKPLEPYVFDVSHSVTDTDIRNHIMGGVSVPRKGRIPLFAPAIVGCVTYTIPYSTRIHHTPFAFNITRRPKIPTRVWDLFTQDVEVPLEDIVFVQNERVLAKRQPD